MWETILDFWYSAQDLAYEHNVDPLVFASLYIGSIPPYLLSIAWLIRAKRKGSPLALPLFSTVFFFIAPAGYIAIVGKDVAWWVYLVLLFLVVNGAYTIYRKVYSPKSSAVTE